MARSVAARYAVGAFAFMAAATWLGVSVTNGFTCLFVFVLALQAVRLYQRRSGSRIPHAESKRDRPTRHEPTWAEERQLSHRAAPISDRARRSGHVYDGDREEPGWSVASEATR